MIELLELTLPTPAENLALDEALLDEAEEELPAGGGATPRRQWLRLWEPEETFVVLGRSSRAENEAISAACAERGVPVLRRSSGGAAIVAAPGCLMYSLVLSYQLHPALVAIDRAHQFVLGTILRGISPLLAAGGEEPAAFAGTSDLAWRGKKFSGNSMRCKRGNLLYHGTLLYKMDLDLADQLLLMPPRQPAYRQQRGHADFLVNLPLARKTLSRALARAWNAEKSGARWPCERTRRLVEEKYSRDEGTRKEQGDVARPGPSTKGPVLERP